MKTLKIRTYIPLLVLFCSISATTANGQSWRFYRHEFQFGLGATNFLGELGGANQVGTHFVRDLEFSMTRPVVTMGYRYRLSQAFAVRGSVYYGRVDGDDATTQEIFRRNRNLRFKSPIAEVSALVEIYPFKEQIGSHYMLKGVEGRKDHALSPYIFGGIGLFWFNPKGEYNGKWYNLREIGTEGQYLPGGSGPYKRIQLQIPSGVGLKYTISRELSLGFEIGARATFTDYIDDVSTVYYDRDAIATNAQSRGLDYDAAYYLADPSLGLEGSGWESQGYINPGEQRGQPNYNDTYMFAIISIHYRLLKGKFNLPKF